MTYTPADLLAAAAREADIYGQTRIPAMLRAGAEAMRECERLRAAANGTPEVCLAFTINVLREMEAAWTPVLALDEACGLLRATIRNLAALQEKPHD